MNPFMVDSSTLKKEAMGLEESEESPLPMRRGQILLQIPGTVRDCYIHGSQLVNWNRGNPGKHTVRAKAGMGSAEG